MRIGFGFGFGLLAFGLIMNAISFLANAEPYACEVKTVAKCVCMASMSVVCKGSDGAEIKSLVEDVQKPATVDYVCGAVSGTLAHPKLTTHEYLLSDAEFKTDAALHDKPVSSASQCIFKGFTADSSKLKLFKEEEGLNPIDLDGCTWMSTLAGGLFASEAHCNLLKVAPSNPSELKNLKFCAGEISCQGKKPEYRVCESMSDSTCPSARECFEQSTPTGNPHQLTITTQSALSPGLKEFPSGKLATVKLKNGQGLCIGQVTADGKTRDVGCLMHKGECGSAKSCLADTNVESTNDFISISGRVYEQTASDLTLVSTNKIAWRVPRSLVNPKLEPRSGQKLILQGKASQIKLVPVPN